MYMYIYGVGPLKDSARCAAPKRLPPNPDKKKYVFRHEF